MYRPLPNFLTIKPSTIEGLGLFAAESITKGTMLGITHIKDKRFEDEYIRTPLGGFFNHSENPNCEILSEEEFIRLKTIKDIKPGEEITSKYTLYNPNNRQV